MDFPEFLDLLFRFGAIASVFLSAAFAYLIRESSRKDKTIDALRKDLRETQTAFMKHLAKSTGVSRKDLVSFLEAIDNDHDEDL